MTKEVEHSHHGIKALKTVFSLKEYKLKTQIDQTKQKLAAA